LHFFLFFFAGLFGMDWMRARIIGRVVVHVCYCKFGQGSLDAG